MDERICDGQICVGEPCDVLCRRACEQLSFCNIESLEDCDASCAEDRPPVLEALPTTAAECRDRWEQGEPDPDCGALLCELHCDQLCKDAEDCGAIDSAAACRIGCLETPPSVCDAVAVAGWTCDELQSDAVCAELRGLEGPAADCRHTPCDDDYDCTPTQTCYLSRCYERCIESWECGTGDCFADICTDPVGTPCNPDTSSCGNSIYCINVDADNRTSDYYCTRSCYSDTPCPDGFDCLEYECRRCSEPEECRYCGDADVCPYIGDGYCDEPEGDFGDCPEGSDPCDC